MHLQQLYSKLTVDEFVFRVWWSVLFLDLQMKKFWMCWERIGEGRWWWGWWRWRGDRGHRRGCPWGCRWEMLTLASVTETTATSLININMFLWYNTNCCVIQVKQLLIKSMNYKISTEWIYIFMLVDVSYIYIYTTLTNSND